MLVSVNDQELDTALTHVSTMYGLYVTQRQNVVNFYVAGIALLSVAYAAALDKGGAPVAVAVCALGVLVSVGAFLQDMHLIKPMAAGEDALRDLQGKLGEKLGLGSFKIQEAIKTVRSMDPRAERRSARCIARWDWCSSREPPTHPSSIEGSRCPDLPLPARNVSRSHLRYLRETST